MISKANKPFGLVLIGGQSSRMGQDKSALQYGDLPEYVRLYQLLSSFCERVYLSCNATQFAKLNTQFNCIQDMVANNGPMEGIKQAFATLVGPWLVVPCDMPQIDALEIRQLIEHQNERDIICFKNETSIIPLLGLWNAAIAPNLKAYEGDSPRKFILEQNHLALPLNKAADFNINTPEERQQYLSGMR